MDFDLRTGKMKRVLSTRPSPAMIVALLALFVALGGSSYAAVKIGARDITRGAVGTRAIANDSIRSADIHNATVSGLDVKDDSLTNADIDNTNLSALTAKSADTATRATTATSATSANTATRATNADNADNAGRLDGLDSADFTRPACTSQTGALKGAVTVAASSGFSSSFAAVPGYNCSGQSIEARRQSMGRYDIRFNGSPATQALATPIVSGFKTDEISVTNTGPGQFTIYVLDPLPAPGAFVDDSFTVLTP
jgi:hypothetical protein